MNPITERFIEFGKRKYGNAYGWQKKYADALGVSPQALTPYLSGKSVPGNKLHKRLREINCDIEWLMTGKKEGEREEQPISREDIELLQRLKSFGIDSLDKLEKLCNPENLAKDVALLLRERMASYKVKGKGKRK